MGYLTTKKSLRLSAFVRSLATGLFFLLTLRNVQAHQEISTPPPTLIRRVGMEFRRNGHVYNFVGANYWQGPLLAAEDGGRKRHLVIQDLNALQQAGVTNLRIITASLGPNSQPWRIVPAMFPTPNIARMNESALEGLDFLLDEMAKRNMTAVICLNNFWAWSGGMAQYLNWFGGGPIPYHPPEPNGNWDGFQRYTQSFYSNSQSLAFSQQVMGVIIRRVNSINGKPYYQDPTIMAWQLANEPRGLSNAAAFNRWIRNTASYIKSLDPLHLITVGTEGETPWPNYAGLNFAENHSDSNVDYSTIHIWAQNWGWYDPLKQEQTYSRAKELMQDYINDHARKAVQMGKPLVIEEFGLARDGGSYSHRSLTTFRDRYFQEVFEQAWRQSTVNHGPVAGVAFWSWSGVSRPSPLTETSPHAAAYWKPGDSFVGDPPHEAQGWYGVYDQDQSTINIIKEYSNKFNQLIPR